MPSISEIWGTEPRERRLAFPCDNLISQPDATLYRGVTVKNSPEIVFRWLCQMRAAPYSYDWIDNLGKQSPRKLSPGLENLAIGQDVMSIFNLVGFEQGRHLTIRIKPRSSASRTFGDVGVSYVIVPTTEHSCRLLVKLIAKYPRGIKGRVMRALLPWGDLIMMRRQLLNFKQLAEATEDQGCGVSVVESVR
jgi:hypothetical protein